MRPFVFFNRGAGVPLLLIGTCWTLFAAEPNALYPGETWPTRTPEQVGLSLAKLDELRDWVGGRGCVVRHGYMVYAWGDQARSGDVASAMKPVVSTLLFLAIQEGKLKSADDPVSDFEPRLKEINHGKDAAITWRHLASQTSGYGLTELPGQAYSYNDYALALYYDTLTQKVFRTNAPPCWSATWPSRCNLKTTAPLKRSVPATAPGGWRCRFATSPGSVCSIFAMADGATSS